MESLLSGVDGVIVFLDDMLITGRSKVEHINNLKRVLNILRDAGLRVCRDKCVSTSSLPLPSDLSQARKRKRRANAAQDTADTRLIEEAITTLRSRSGSKHDDYCIAYGRHVGNTLKLCDRSVLPHVVKAMNDLLYDAQVGLFATGVNTETEI